MIFFAQVPVGEPVDPARDAMLATLDGVAKAADHRGRGRPRAREVR